MEKLCFLIFPYTLVLSNTVLGSYKRQKTITNMDIEHLCGAAAVGDDAKVREIMASGLVDVNSYYAIEEYADWKDWFNDGSSPLHYAMQFNHPKVVSTLLASELTRLNVFDFYDWTPLHWACDKNNVECVKLFVSDSRSTPQIINMKSKAGETALMVAVRSGNLDSVWEMAELAGTDFGTENSDDKTLMEVAIEGEHKEFVKFLKERNSIQGAEGEARNTAGNLIMREIVVELDDIEVAIASVEEKHKTKVADLEEEHMKKIADLEEKHKDEIDSMKQKKKFKRQELKAFLNL